MNILDLSEQEIIRRNSLDEMRKLGIEPYPAAEYPVNAYSQEIKNNFVDGAETPRQVAIAGRIMSRRIMGKASFIELKDSEGRIQVYISRDDLCPGEDKELYNTVFKKLLDIGDFIGIRGFVFRTQMGEITVHAQELTVLAKSIRPLPIVKMKDGVAYDAFEDPELRYRQRYVDLVVNEGVKDIFIKRNKVYNSMREYFNSRGYLEVETPILQSIPGGAAARPFITHHNALDIPLYLRIADELYLKRLIVGGFEGVYEFSKNFRNEGMDRTHNPEFTCMEIYVSYKDYNWMMDFTEKMLEKICLDVNGTTEVKVGENTINFKTPFKRITRRYQGTHGYRHQRHGRSTIARSLQKNRGRGRRNNGQRKNHRRNIRREMRRPLHTAHLYHRLSYRDVAAHQTSSEQPRTDRTFRANGKRERTL